MIGIIQDWLFNQLGIYFNLDKLEENNYFVDGSVFASIFTNYGLLNSDYTVNITKGWEHEVCQKNLKLLKPIFNMLSVNFDNNVILDIIMSNKVTTFKLLYELYVCLENKQHLYFITQEKFDRVQKSHIGGLNKDGIFITKVKKEVTTKDEDKCLKKPLVDNKDLIEWYKIRYKRITNNINSRLDQLKNSSNGNDSQMCYANMNQKRRCPCSCTSSAPDQELVAVLPDFDMFSKSSNHDRLLDYKQFIASFKAKQHRNSEKQCFEKNIQNELLQQTWNQVMEKQNEMYNLIFSQIMLKQSQYEKQILTKLIQTQTQVKTENDNLIHASTKIIEEEDKQITVDFKMKEEFVQLKNIYENEQKRVLELHGKLNKQKQDLAKRKRRELCSDVLDSFIDLAFNASEYQSKYGVPVPMVLWNSWKQYFYKSQPIHIPFQTLEQSISADESFNYDDIIDFEKQKSAIVNENDIDEYLYTCGRWFFETLCREFGYINENPLAYVVYRLLSLKYPPPPSPLPANLPPFKVAGVLLDFYNADCIGKLKTLLSKPGVHIFDSETAIKTCISKFEEETLCDRETKISNKSKQTKSDKNKKSKKKGGSVVSNKDKTGKKSGKKKKRNTEIDQTKGVSLEEDKEGAVNLINKETQTSIIIEEQTIHKKIERSALGLIGEQVFNTLKEGKTIEDDLLVNVLIEYLKTLNDYDGWILLNYPTTINQASIIELALSGKRLPIEDYILENDKVVVEELVKDENSLKRVSKILQCPVDEKYISTFKTYFTVFIKTKPTTAKPPEPLVVEDHKNKDTFFSKIKEITESKHFGMDSDTILPDTLEEFYKDLPIYQNFYCESYDLVVLKKLARIILKNDSLEQTASVDLFGKETLDKLSKTDKKGKKDKDFDIDKSKISSKTKENKKLVRNEDESTTDKKMLATENNNKVETKQLSLDMEHTTKTTKESLQTTKPSDVEWEFVALPLVEDIAVILATIWENIENSYLQNLMNICFENRLINLRLVPYSTYVKKTVESVATKLDMRQDLVSQFQKYYVGLDYNLRILPEVKNHLFCKVLEMQQNLWQIIDDKKNEVESKRKEVIHENWLVNEICMLINNYLSLVQTEFNRSVGTLKLVSDYYLTMLDKNSTAMMNSHLIDSKVTKVTVDDLMFELYEILQNPNNDPENVDLFLKRFSNQSVKINVVAENLIECQENENVVGSIINSFLPRDVERMTNHLQSITNAFLIQIKTEEDFLVDASKKLAKKHKQNDSSNRNKSVTKEGENPNKSKEISKLKKLSDNKSNKVIEKDLMKKSVFDDNNIEFDTKQKELLLTEWKFVINTELDRFKLRMNLIHARAQEDIMEFYCYLESVFCELLTTNLSKYDTDIDNTNKLCDYLRTAIEEESLLTYPIVLKRSQFFVDITQNLTKEHKHDEIKELFEHFQDCYFTINQLKKLMGIFKIAGPHGVIRKQPFCYILQDLMLFNDNDNQPHLPRLWNFLNESQLLVVLEGLFGSEYGINWRDFIIYNLEILYPSSDEILSLRKKFMSYDMENAELVPKEVYDSIKLWFEHDLPNNPQEGLRFALVKELLWEMFQVSEEMVNYTALLLYFCKDYDSKIGFKKALCLAVGKNVITSKNELDEILKEEAEIKASVVNLLENIINSIVHYKEGTLIYEAYESMTDLDFDHLDTNYSVSEKSESEYSSFYSTNTITEIDNVQNNFPEEKQSFTPSQTLADNEILDVEKAWVSKIPVATVVSILNASFLHQDKDFSLRNQYLNCLEEESDNKGLIEAHVLVATDCMNKLFQLTNQFKISSPCEILEKCLKIEPNNHFGLIDS